MATVFSMIINGTLPGHFVWKDEHVVAIMTIQPFRDGHVLVIPRAEIDHFDDVPEQVAARLMVVSQRIAKALKQAFPCERIGMMIAGMEVPHTHLHLFPVNELGDLSFSQAKDADQDTLRANAARIRAALVELGYPEGRCED